MPLAKQLYNIAKTLPDETLLALLNLIQTLNPPTPITTFATARKLPPGTLTGLRGIAKQLNLADTTPQDDYTHHLINKYQ